MRELLEYYTLGPSQQKERCSAFLRCQQSGNAYFNYAEEFVGNSDLLGAHRSALWAQGFAEDCCEILGSLPMHIDFLTAASLETALPCTREQLTPGSTAYASMQRMVITYLDPKEVQKLKTLFQEKGLPIYGFEHEAQEFMGKATQTAISIGFGVSFIVVLLVLSIAFPNPTPFQYQVFRTVLALAGAGAAAAFPGFIEIRFGKWLRAGGALAVFAVLYFVNPAQLVTKSEQPRPAASPVACYRIDGKDMPRRPTRPALGPLHLPYAVLRCFC